MKVEQILRAKGADVETIAPHATVADAAHRLRSKGIGSLVVSSGDGRVDGLISERDIVLGLARHGGRVLELRVADVMTRSVTACTPTDTLKHVMAQMTLHRNRHLPVVENGRLCGIISIGDVVKNRLEELELETTVMRDAYLARS
jgi:CBS domain-containing protein